MLTDRLFDAWVRHGAVVRAAAVCLSLALPAAAASHAAPVTDLKTIVLGKHHGCGITQAGALRCFGNNDHGQLGVNKQLPGAFSARALTVLPSAVSDVAVADKYTCAVIGGALSCWGSNESGQLGLGKAGSDVKLPTRSSAVSGVVTSVAAGGGTTCVILAPDGTLQCWGRNDLGQVGSGSSDAVVARPTVVIPSGVTAVSVGGQQTCAVVNAGLQCWGFFLFKGDTFRTERIPLSIIPDGQGVTAVAVALHSCAIVRGALQCWGRNFHDQVGVPEGARVAPQVPTSIIASGVAAVAVSDENTCAVANGGLRCWGWNNRAQLGAAPSLGSKVPMPLPVPGVPPASIHAVAIGMNQTCVLAGTASAPGERVLQCTNRARLPEDVDENEPAPPGNPWLAFGTQDVGLAEPPPVLPRIARYGLWHGAIGTEKVMVLLAPPACEARYYYRKHRWGIGLQEKDRRQGKVWREPHAEGGEAIWNFAAVSPDAKELTGEWVGHDGLRRVPIRLTLSSALPSRPGDDGKPRYDCGVLDNAFDAPRIASARQGRAVASTDTVFRNGGVDKRYRQVSVLGDHIRGFALSDMGEVPRLRRALQDWEGESISQFYECADGMRGRTDMRNPDFNRALEPQFWNSRLLVLRETYSNYCGGAHPSGGVSGYLAWDLAADRRVDVWKWIKGTDQPGHIASKRLLDILKTSYGRRNETGAGACADALEGKEFFLMYPSAAGMVFTPSLPRVIQACEEDIEIPWAKMRPFLTPAGNEAASGLLAVR